MEANDYTIKLEYNTERSPLCMPEYGRNVKKMVDYLKTIEDREERTQQAKAVIKVMEILNPSVKVEDNWAQRLWDHLYIMAGFDLDVDSPYPMPNPEQLNIKPMAIPLEKRPIKANHYGRNIESIIDLIAEEPEGDNKTYMLKALAVYMRQQYLIWNKDSVADETIFSDIEKLSDYRIRVPEGLSLSKISSDTNFSRPGLNLDFSTQNNRKQGAQKRSFSRKNNQKR